MYCNITIDPTPPSNIPSCSTEDSHRNGMISQNARWYKNEQRWWIPVIIDPSFGKRPGAGRLYDN